MLSESGQEKKQEMTRLITGNKNFLQMIKLNNGNYGIAISESNITEVKKTAIAELDTNLNTQWLKVYGSSGTSRQFLRVGGALATCDANGGTRSS